MATQKHMGRHEIIKRLAAQVGDEGKALGILRKNGIVDKEGNLTAKGKKRDSMTARERAIDRASKASGKPASSYKYNPKTNRATRK